MKAKFDDKLFLRWNYAEPSLVKCFLIGALMSLAFVLTFISAAQASKKKCFNHGLFITI